MIPLTFGPPLGQVTTANGSLVITMAKQQTDSYQYTSGMLQSWNKFCFQAGYIEVSVSLPGNDQNTGFVSCNFTPSFFLPSTQTCVFF